MRTAAGAAGAVAVEASGVKVLIAGSGQHPDDFSRTIPGELVFPGQVCGRDDLDRGGDGSCGCGRAFVGAASHSPTTVAIVVDRREVDLDQLAVLLHDSATVAGWQVDTDWAAEFAADLAEEAASWPVGTRLRRTLEDELVPE